jgi:hypothetical protein
MDAEHWRLSEEMSNYLQIHGGNIQNPSKLTSLNGTAATGTMSWTEINPNSGARTFTGVGTNWLTMFCGGVAGPANGEALIVPVIEPDYGGVDGPRRYAIAYVQSCTSDTEIAVNLHLHSTRDLTATNATWAATPVDRTYYPSERQGAVYVANGATTVYGIGTAFQAAFCNGGTTAVSNAAIRISDGTTFTRYNVTGCTSDTQLTIGTAFAGTTINSPGTSAYDIYRAAIDYGTWGITAASNIFFYDNAAAHYALWFRSGHYKALQSARWLSREIFENHFYQEWATLYEMGASYGIAATVDKQGVWGDLDPWPILVERANRAAQLRMGTSIPDQREVSYAVWLNAILALYHPDADTRATYRTNLINHYNNQAAPYQHPQGGYYSWYNDHSTAQTWQVANGSATVTLHAGATVDSKYCGTFDSIGGTISVDTDRVTVTGTGTNFVGSGGKMILMKGTCSGSPCLQISQIKTSPTPTATAITLEHPWRGDSGALSAFKVRSSGEAANTNLPLKTFYRAESNGDITVPWQIDLDDAYWCEVTDGSTLTLDRPYEGDTSGGNVYRKIGGQDGFTWVPWWNQPYMDGLRTEPYYLAHKALESTNPTESAGFLEIMGEMLEGLYANRNTTTNGLNYFDYAPTCYPRLDTSKAICNTLLDTGEDRDYWMEAMRGWSRYYLAESDLAKREAIRFKADSVMNWLWARSGYRAPFTGDGGNLSFISIAANYSGFRQKVFGQAFGHGGGTTWPAARTRRGRTAPDRRILVGFYPSGTAGTQSVQLRTVSPSGRTDVHSCSTGSPCELTIREPKGAVLLRIEYLGGSNSELARSVWTVVELER